MPVYIALPANTASHKCRGVNQGLFHVCIWHQKEDVSLPSDLVEVILTSTHSFKSLETKLTYVLLYIIPTH